jgi:hypothetical protein
MRLRGTLGLCGLCVLAALAFTSRRSDAALRFCPSGVEHFVLTPTGGVTDDGLILQRTDGGRYTLDSGQQFDVERADLTALDAGVTECGAAAQVLELEVIEPFGDGGRVRVQVSR